MKKYFQKLDDVIWYHYDEFESSASFLNKLRGQYSFKEAIEEFIDDCTQWVSHEKMLELCMDYYGGGIGMKSIIDFLYKASEEYESFSANLYDYTHGECEFENLTTDTTFECETLVHDDCVEFVFTESKYTGLSFSVQAPKDEVDVLLPIANFK